VPEPTVTGLDKHAFYVQLIAAQDGYQPTPAELAAARLDARRMDVGWVLLWNNWRGVSRPAVGRYLGETGFRLAYTADGVTVFRPGTAAGGH